VLVSTSVSGGGSGCHQGCGRGSDHGYLALHAGQVRGVVQRRQFAGVSCKREQNKGENMG